jgi:hypothetical protein
MITIVKSTNEKCFICQSDKDTVQVRLDNKELPLCWKDAKKMFESREPKPEPVTQ